MAGVNVTGTSRAMVRDDRIEGGDCVIPFRGLIRLRRPCHPHRALLASLRGADDLREQSGVFTALFHRRAEAPMPVDALDPGPLGNYPWFPRDRNGVPLWSDSEMTDGQAIDGVAPMPRGERATRRRGLRIVLDVTPRDHNGQPISPPVIAP